MSGNHQKGNIMTLIKDLKMELAMDLLPIPTCCVCGKSTSRSRLMDMLDSDEMSAREIIISGTHPECWDLLFGDDEE